MNSLFNQNNLQRLLKSIKWCLVILVAVVVITAIAGTVLIGTAKGRLWLAQTAIDQLNSSAALHISAKGLAIPQLGHWRATNITVSQNQKTWMVIDDLNLRWQPQALFDHSLIIDHIFARSFSLHKLPATTEADKDNADKTNYLASELPAIELKKLTIESLNLYGFLADDNNQGNEQSSLHYAVNANANWIKNSPLQIDLNARGLNDIPATINLQVQSDDWVHTSLTGSLSEAAGGFFGERLQLPKQQAIQADFAVAVTASIDSYAITLQNLSFPLAQRNLVAQGDFTVATKNQAVQINDLVLTVDDSRHTISGSLIEQQLDFEVNTNKLPLDISSPWQQTVDSGELTTRLNITGTLAQPQAQGHIALNMDYQQLPVVVDFTGLMNKNLLRIDTLNAQLAQADLQAQGEINLTTNTSQLNVTANNFDLTTLAIFDLQLPSQLEATITNAKATLHGPIKNPQGELFINGEGRYEQQPFTLQSHLTKDETTVVIHQTTLAVADGNITAQGSIQPETLDADLAINADSLSIAPLKLAGINLPETLTATVSTQLKLQGNLRSPSIAGDAKIQGDYEEIPFIVNAKGYHQSDESQLETLTVSSFDEQVFTASGHYHQEVFDINLQAKKLPSQLFSALGWHIQPGKFNADLQAQGSLKSPTIDGHLSYATVFSGYDDEGDENDIDFIWDLDINSNIDAINFASTFTRDNHPPGKLLIQVPTQPYLDYVQQSKSQPTTVKPLPLAATLTGNFSLQTVSFLLNPDLHRFTGNLSTDISIGGSLEKPTLKGDLHLEQARYENPVTGTLVTNIDCLLTAEQILLSIDNCQASDDSKGSYALAGTILLPANNSVGNVDLKLQANSANILRRTDIESEATGEIVLSGDFSDLLASGSLEVAPFTAIFDTNFSSGIPSIKVEEVQSLQTTDQAADEKISIQPKLRFDLEITATQQAYLRGHGLEAELQGQINIHGDLKKPLYVGEFKTVRGVFDVFNKKFDIEQGQVNFANNAIGLTFTGVYEEDDQQIQADISGTNDDIEITFSAIPDIPEDEILAFIIFGKPIQTITPFEAVQLASAVQTLRGGGSKFFDPIGKTREALGVDTLSIESATTDEGDSGVNIGIGKYINEKVYLELERTPNPSQPWKGNLEIELTPSINLESSTGGQTGIEGAEITWKRDY
jgi:translocation and assembly module TamB